MNFFTKHMVKAATLIFIMVPFIGHAGELPGKKQTDLGLYVTAVQAAEMLADPNVLLIDVRTRAEVAFVGLPARVNVNIPVMVLPAFAEYNATKGTYKLEQNTEFASVFQTYAQANGIAKDQAIILMCRSGSRSARAVNILDELGYSNVYSLVDGFEGDKVAEGPDKGERVVNGWKNAGLDWSYKLAEVQVYPEDR